MTVVQFPDEIIRQFLARLDSSRRFSDYLDALAYCARKELDPSPLHAWWKANAAEVVSDNFELDFVDFLNGIITSKQTWAERRVEHLARIAEEKKNSENEGKTDRENMRLAREFLTVASNQVTTRNRFMEENPEYRCVDSAKEYHAIFSGLFGERDNPLKVMARWASELLPCGLPAKERIEKQNQSLRPKVYFDAEDERPAAFLIGSAPHAHLIALAVWVAEQVQNAKLATVLHWTLNGPGSDWVPSSVMKAVCSCSHATFVHLICHHEAEPEDVDGLVPLLKLPLALNASASGPPHLLPGFNFLGAASECSSNVYDMEHGAGRKDLVNAWRKFFREYRILRIRSNGSRGFVGCEHFFVIAIQNYADGDQRFWEEPNSTCVADFIRDITPDETCLVDFLLQRICVQDETVHLDATGDLFDTPLLLKNLLLPMLAFLREKSMHELASAVLAYYLVLAAIATQGNLDELEGFDEAIITSRRLPGSACVERALQVMCELAAERGHKLTQMKFEQFLVLEDRKIRELILGGEGETVEFKSTLRVNLHTGQPDRKIEHAALKTIAAFLNKRGGILLIGVDDAGSVLGTEPDSFPSADKLLLHFKNLVNATARDAIDLIDFKMVTLEQKEILYVACRRGDQPIYLFNRDTKQHEFYVRRGPATDQLDMPDAFAYIQKEFTGSRLVGLE